MTIMYCPNCERNTFTKRGNFSYLLAFLLAFTGLGLIIYILYYLDKKQNRCTYCETVCIPRIPNDKQPNLKGQIEEIPKEQLEFKPMVSNEVKASYCSSCGGNIGDREGIKYCALCGTHVD